MRLSRKYQFFFYGKILSRKKAPKRKTNDFQYYCGAYTQLYNTTVVLDVLILVAPSDA